MIRALGVVAALAVATLAQAPSAQGYVRSRTEGCHAVFWPQSCVYVTADSALTADLPNADTLRLIQASIAAWEDNKSGTYLKLNFVAPNAAREARFDHVPTIKFRTGRWCRPADCGGGKESCYDASAAAITTVFFIDKPTDATQDGTILDADIEMNDVNNYFYEATPGGIIPPRKNGRGPADLWNTLTHELGHLQGLEHTCRISDNDGLPACTLDNKGQAPPYCSDVISNQGTNPDYAIIAETTMFASATPGETKKRVPKADDQLALTETYPAAKDPKKCAQPTQTDPCAKTSTGCAMTAFGAGAGGAGTAGGLGLLLLVGLALVLRRRLV